MTKQADSPALGRPPAPDGRSLFGAAECELLAEAARLLAPRVPELVRRWSAALALPKDLPKELESAARRLIENVNHRVLAILVDHLCKGDPEAALRDYHDSQGELIASQMSEPSNSRITLEQFLESGQIAQDILEAELLTLFCDDPLKQARTIVAFTRLWAFSLQGLARIYSRLREEHLERLRAEVVVGTQRLRASEERFEAFMRHLPGAAFIRDTAGRYLFVNETIEKISARSLEDWVGKTNAEIWPGSGAERQAGAERAMDSDRQVLAQRLPLQLVETVPDPRGEKYWLVNKFPILDATGEPIMLGGVSIDITEQKRAEEQLAEARDAALEASRLKSAFLANMSHEIRTPLNVILGYNALISEHLSKLGDQSQRAYLAGVARAGRRLMDTVHGVLDISQIESGAFEVRRVELDLASSARRVMEDMQLLARDKGLALSCLIDTPDTHVRFDEYCISQALTNLVHNAIKFSDKGGVSVRLYRDAESQLCLEVSDTGIGISKAYLPRLFEPFSQEMSGYTRPYEGSGLGLALVKKYVELNQAAVSVESEKTKGSRFTIRFSRESEVRPSVQRVEIRRSASSAPLAARSAKPLVLVVEDDPDTQGYMMAILERQYEILLAASGDELRQQLANRPGEVALVLMDLSLKGGEDGLALTRYLRSQEPFKAIPVIATTAHAFEDDRLRALAAGCTAYLSKPFKHHELLSLMDGCITTS